jgi:hypothetical protein
VDHAELERRFLHHPATEATSGQHAHIRARCLTLADYLNELLPEGPEKVLAVMHLEEVKMWANAAIAQALGDQAEGDRQAGLERRHPTQIG